MTQAARMSSAPQHLRALERANAVRLARAELKRKVATGDVSAADVILRSPWEAGSMTVADLLGSQRRWGQTRCRRFLQAVPMSESKTIGTMTDRQRLAIADMLTGHSGSRRVPIGVNAPVLAAVGG